MMRAYGVRARLGGHHVSDGGVVLVATALVVGVWQGGALVGLMVGGLVLAAALLGRQSVVVLGACAIALLVGSVAGARAWQEAQPRHLGPYAGWALMVGDPAPFGQGLRVTLQIEGERFDAWLYGGPRRKLVDRQGGEYVWVDGDRAALSSSQRRALVRHVVGRFDAEVVGDVVDGSAMARASNRVRLQLRGVAAATMAADDASLFTGLVIGDDSRQPTWLIDDFRASGLSHLTAVSGQNVAFVLAAALPLLRRLRPWWRWATTVGLVAWFMALTRFEPSVLRAGVMAILGATAYVRGRQTTPVRLLALAVLVLVVVDPLLVWSVGFWLSVGATAGVCVVGPWLYGRLPGPAWVRLPLAITLGAQVGVALPSLLVFNRLPIVSLPANVAAVPVAGFVMLYGLPAGLVASMLPQPLKGALLVPAEVGTRWVSTVARLAAAIEPSPGWSALCWVVVVVVVVVWIRHRWRVSATGVPI